MKDKRIVPTGKERVMREDDFIVSKTDLTGRITYGNSVFIEYSGYSEEELLGTQHNIIRHPEMPRATIGDRPSATTRYDASRAPRPSPPSPRCIGRCSPRSNARERRTPSMPGSRF